MTSGTRPIGTDELHYLVLEMIEGESLADRLAKGPLPLEEVLRYGTQIASALDAAHKQGIVHRDLKPGNVMITKAGAKLLDFGLAGTGEAAGAGEVLSTLRTRRQAAHRAGTILGTFQYMAPEQLEGQPADARTDIFALGALLYEMATGRRAFTGPIAHEPDRCDRLLAAAAHLQRPGDEPARPRPRDPQVPREGSRGPLAERARRDGGAAVDRGGRLARRPARGRDRAPARPRAHRVGGFRRSRRSPRSDSGSPGRAAPRSRRRSSASRSRCPRG